MNPQSSPALQQFKNYVGIKFQLYNSLFTSLPFHRIERTGILLSLFQIVCEDGYKKKLSPVEIVESFFSKHTSYTAVQEKMDLLFRFIQYVERQVVLFDALEDAGFKDVNDINGAGTLKQLVSEVIQNDRQEDLAKKLKNFQIRLVLTAHPTQFYPDSVLGIINDLAKALGENNGAQINVYLQQLGKTAFFKKEKPTPYDEAVSLIWYLENVFYVASGKIISTLKNNFPDAVNDDNPIINMGFWPGGDRDGNPNVNADITCKVAEALRSSIIKCYYLDVRRLKRRLTFKGVDVILQNLELQLYDNLFIPGERTDLTRKDIISALSKISEILIYQHNGLFLHLVNNLLNKVHVFGLHFAALDIRQESTVHVMVIDAVVNKENILPKNYKDLPTEERMNLLFTAEHDINREAYEGVIKDSLDTTHAVRKIQQYNGEEGCSRYIISQCNSALNIAEVVALFLLCGWKKEELTVDVVPLFETVDDMQNASSIMKTLYNNEHYKVHLKRRNNRQTIMLGFSDGTKDGGYLMANWSIYKAKEELTKISHENGINVIFFDGRGGPPARGGGKTNKFYASMGKNIANKEIQLTIQGQTVSSNFGTVDSAQYNIEQLLNAGISNDLFAKKEVTLNPAEEKLLNDLSVLSLNAYNDLKNHPDFLPYLLHVSPLKFYSETNIGSRPAKRGASSKLNLKDLRAIPFVGAWSQLKQNVTGYYGVGCAMQKIDEQGRLGELKDLYKNSVFFKTLIDNCEMAMKKCFFPLTEFLSNHPVYGELWNNIYQEFELTQKYIFHLSGKNELMADYPVEQLSILMRERIVLPLLTIQQYAIARIREAEENNTEDSAKETYSKLIIRSSFGIINAGRNSA